MPLEAVLDAADALFERVHKEKPALFREWAPAPASLRDRKDRFYLLFAIVYDSSNQKYVSESESEEMRIYSSLTCAEGEVLRKQISLLNKQRTLANERHKLRQTEHEVTALQAQLDRLQQKEHA
jgi:hypothetical protein